MAIDLGFDLDVELAAYRDKACTGKAPFGAAGARNAAEQMRARHPSPSPVVPYPCPFCGLVETQVRDGLTQDGRVVLYETEHGVASVTQQPASALATRTAGATSVVVVDEQTLAAVRATTNRAYAALASELGVVLSRVDPGAAETVSSVVCPDPLRVRGGPRSTQDRLARFAVRSSVAAARAHPELVHRLLDLASGAPLRGGERVWVVNGSHVTIVRDRVTWHVGHSLGVENMTRIAALLRARSGNAPGVPGSGTTRRQRRKANR